MGLSLRCRVEQTIKLNQKQRLRLKNLQKLAVGLRCLGPPDYQLRGLSGMIEADSVLKEKNLTGILIGGLSEAIWNQKRKEEELLKHKDVDVLITNKDSRLDYGFSHGIDWWTPRTGIINVKGKDTNIENYNAKWWENGNGAVLRFGMESSYNAPELNPGLYILDRKSVIDMRVSEIKSETDYKNIQVDYDIFKKFEEEVDKRIKTRIPKYISQEFKGQILSSKYDERYFYKDIEVFRIEGDILMGIKNRS